jgi:hypothetical protein
LIRASKSDWILKNGWRFKLIKITFSKSFERKGMFCSNIIAFIAKGFLKTDSMAAISAINFSPFIDFSSISVIYLGTSFGINRRQKYQKSLGANAPAVFPKSDLKVISPLKSTISFL